MILPPSVTWDIHNGGLTQASFQRLSYLAATPGGNPDPGRAHQLRVRRPIRWRRQRREIHHTVEPWNLKPSRKRTLDDLFVLSQKWPRAAAVAGPKPTRKRLCSSNGADCLLRGQWPLRFTWTVAKFNGDTVTLPPFQRSICVKISH